jgi:hypothetical protein
MHTPYYERMLTETVIAPWYDTVQEASYMNGQKLLNEPYVETYRELDMGPIPQNNNSEIEGFGENTQSLIFKILSAIFIVILICYLLKQIR